MKLEYFNLVCVSIECCVCHRTTRWGYWDLDKPDNFKAAMHVICRGKYKLQEREKEHEKSNSK